MKTLNKVLIISLLLFSISINLIYAQNECGTEEIQTNSPFVNDFFGGYFKPHRSDYSNGVQIPPQANASFNMLFAFIDFPDETTQSSEWPIGQPPVFINKYLDSAKNNSGNFWNRYRDSSLSDYYQELSKGAFHVTGEARHLTMYHTWLYYKDTVGYNGFLTEIYSRLKNDTSINWSKFDQWSRNNSTDNYVFAKDGFLDMMGIFIRHLHGTDFTAAPGYAGYVPLFGPTFTVFANSTDTVRINPTRSEIGSGFIVKGNQGPLGYNRAMGIAIHEYGHYLFSNNHSTSGIMTSNGGISINDLFMSGYEKYKLGLLDTQTVNYTAQSSYTIGDVSGRNGSPQLLRVPISNSEFFIVENRRKISNWDVYMLGDTSQTDPFKNTGDYGKGVYIYHNNNIGINYAGNIDVECADGLWNWAYQGTTTPDWSNTQQVSILKRIGIPNPLNNDNGYFNSLSNSDGVSACSWFSVGKKHTQINSLPGIDKIYVNETEYWTSREIWGDRWDAWNVGYNEIFSPYSNPNTKTSANGESGIFIYYYELSSGIANVKVYRASEYGGSISLDSILKLTPPSKPMGIKIEEYYPPNTSICKPMIVWNHNRELDMWRGKSGDEKRYRIFKSKRTNMSQVPIAYTLLAEVDLVDNGTDPAFYIDNTETLYDCAEYDQPPYGVAAPVRYKIQAVDNGPDNNVRYSVLSDFASDVVISEGGIGVEEAPGMNGVNFENNIPSQFDLYQNFPNPFNPVTNIQFDLPQDVFVSIKIYDLSGKEILTLVNGFRNAGSYTTSFDASKLSSGVYFYKVNAGNYSAVKKMILLK